MSEDVRRCQKMSEDVRRCQKPEKKAKTRREERLTKSGFVEYSITIQQENQCSATLANEAAVIYGIYGLSFMGTLHIPPQSRMIQIQELL